VFGELMIDESTYTSRLSGRPLELTYKEFELLKYLARHPGRVVTRAELLREIWGHDFYGGIRTVDVHIRRLRAKLGPEHQKLIGTVRSVGYRFLRPAHTRAAPSDTHAPEPPAGRDRIATGSAGFPLPDAEACCRVDEIVGGGSAQTPAGNPASSCG
jgi:DNA-binding winged helix-turn-helix (wHTH) protein